MLATRALSLAHGAVLYGGTRPVLANSTGVGWKAVYLTEIPHDDSILWKIEYGCSTVDLTWEGAKEDKFG